MEMTPLEKNYKIKERAEDAVKIHGSIEKAINYLKSELESFNSYFIDYSYECLGHGITCNKLLISWLEKQK